MPASPQPDHESELFLREEIARLEQRLARVENSQVFRTLRAIGGTAHSWKSRLGQALLRSPLHPLYLKLFPPSQGYDPYNDFLKLERARALTPEQARHEQESWPARPRVTLLMAAYRSRPEWLEQAVESVREQSYANWQLSIALDAAHESPELVSYLEQLARSDERIVVSLQNAQGGISETLNAAAAKATGEYVGVLDHDDLLAPHALHYCVEAALREQADVVYTDEDYLNVAGERVQPSFKPAWSPDLLLSCMYFGHFWMLRRDLAARVGWFRREYDGAQDHDLVLRVTRDPAIRVAHVARVLYHWRQHAGSTAAHASAKPYAHEAGKRAVADATGAVVKDGPRTHTYFVERPAPKLSISIVIVTRTGALLRRALASFEPALQRTPAQIVVVHHVLGPDTGVAEVCQEYKTERVEWGEPFHFSLMNQRGVDRAVGEVLVFVNDDVIARDGDWLQALGVQCMRPEVACVGARLVYPDGLLQHGGIVLGAGELTDHIGRNMLEHPLWHWLHLTRNVSAVTGACLAIRKELYERIGGFDAAFPVNFNDVDLCLRASEHGRVVLEAQATLIHEECRTRAAGVTFAEREAFARRWSERLRRPDPYFHPALLRGLDR